MKKVILLLFLTVCFVSCKSEHDKNISKMEMVVKKDLEEFAFKENSTIEFLEFKTISIDTVTQNYIDTMRIGKMVTEAEELLYVYDILTKKLDNRKNIIRLQRSMGWRDLVEMQIEHYNRESEELEQCKNALENISIQMQSLQDSINTRKNPKKYYKAEMYIKAVITKNNSKETENVSDTLFNFFGTNLERCHFD